MNARQYFLLAMSFLVITACERDDVPAPTVKPDQSVTAPPSASSGEYAAKKDFLAKTRKELDSLQQELDALKQKMAKASATQKEKIKSEVEKFQQQQKKLEEKWSAFQQESSDAWKSLEKSFTKSIEDLRDEIRKSNQ